MTVSKNKKSEYNRSAYLKRKEKKDEQRRLAQSTEDNIRVEPVVPTIDETPPSTEIEELEISQEDYNKFLQWQRSTKDIEQIKKKVEDPSYALNILKTIGLAAVPALLGMVQRALQKTLEQQQQKPQGTRSEHFTEESVVTGSSQWDPLSAPKFSTA